RWNVEEGARAAAPAATTSGIRGSHALLRTVATLAASAGGYALAEAYHEEEDPDRLVVPIAAGAMGGAIAGLIFSNGHPLKVVGGSILSTL
ncbi:hypothetical protein RSW31_24710, partial [Escherichia coli]|uniref:hypothetical protein n=1 Tax=Escherichia coli TaxID=562 RepID=UPI0028DF9F3A